MLFVRRNLSANSETTPKGKRARSLPMTEQLRDALAELVQRQDNSGPVLKQDNGRRWTRGMATWSILKSNRQAGVSEGRMHFGFRWIWRSGPAPILIPLSTKLSAMILDSRWLLGPLRAASN